MLHLLKVGVRVALKANYYKRLDLKILLFVQVYFSILTISHVSILIVRVNTGPRVDQILS